MHLQITGSQHPGDRKYQEDSFTQFGGDNWHLLAVADGIGGHPHGDLASAACMQALIDAQPAIEAAVGTGNTNSVLTAVKNAYTAAHRACLESNDTRGSTLVCLLILGKNGWMFNCGDSFGFAYRDHKPFRITNQHVGPWGGLLTCIGGMTASEAAYQQNTVPHCDIHDIGDITQYQYLVLASDGIVDPNRMPWPDKYDTPAESILQAGLSLYESLAPGRCDNVTVLCLDPH